VATTFAELRRQVLGGALLSADYFAEDLTYQPAAGPPRTVRALVQPATSDLRERPDGLVSVEEIDVRLARDEALDYGGVVLGGVERPRLGDGLFRAGEPDPWSFDRVLKMTADTWLLRFIRERVEQIGATQTQKG